MARRDPKRGHRRKVRLLISWMGKGGAQEGYKLYRSGSCAALARNPEEAGFAVRLMPCLVRPREERRGRRCRVGSTGQRERKRDPIARQREEGKTRCWGGHWVERERGGACCARWAEVLAELDVGPTEEKVKRRKAWLQQGKKKGGGKRGWAFSG